MKMEWFDNLINPKPEPEEAEVTEVSLTEILGAANLEAGISCDGKKIGSISSDIHTDPNTFDLSMFYRLKVAADQWENTTVVCDGNALDITIGTLPDGRYSVKRTVRAYRPATYVEDTVWELKEFETTKDFINYVENLDNDGVEILRQIYYDRWCFDTANQKDRMYFDLLEEEKKIRE
jgi:hypothetical protein